MNFLKGTVHVMLLRYCLFGMFALKDVWSLTEFAASVSCEFQSNYMCEYTSGRTETLSWESVEKSSLVASLNGETGWIHCKLQVLTSWVNSILLGRLCYSIGGPFPSLSVCLPRCVLWQNGARYAYSVYISRIGM